MLLSHAGCSRLSQPITLPGTSRQSSWYAQVKGMDTTVRSAVKAGVLDVDKKDGIVDLCGSSLLGKLSTGPKWQVCLCLCSTESIQVWLLCNSQLVLTPFWQVCCLRLDTCSTTLSQGHLQVCRLQARHQPAGVLSTGRSAQGARVQVGKSVHGRVELVKEHYVVLSVQSKQGCSLAFAATHDFNSRDADSHRTFSLGQSLSATVTSLPSPATGKLCLSCHTARTGQVAQHSSKLKPRPEALLCWNADAFLLSV